MAESVVAERAKIAKYSVAIFRPTIVVSTLKNPFPGWIENLNGPSGLIVGIGKGLLHVSIACENVRSDQLPVDMAIDSLIAISWGIATDKPREAQVYNCSTMENPITNRKFKEAVIKSLHVYPLGKPMWYPFVLAVQNRYLYKILELCFQTLPLYTITYMLRLLGVKSSNTLIIASQRLSAMSKVLSFFITNEWIFDNKNIQRLRARLSKSDAEIFNLDPTTIDWDEYYTNFVYGTRRYLVNKSDNDLQADRRFFRLLQVLHYSLTFTIIIYTIKAMINFQRRFRLDKKIMRIRL